MKLAFLTTDNRDQQGKYDLPAPFFGTAMTALLEGFTMIPDEISVHVISCSKRRMAAPQKLADNIWFHQPVVPKLGWGRTAFVGCGLAVRGLLQQIKPDIVHAQGTERDCAVSMMLAPRGPRLLTIHGHMARIAELVGAKFPSYYWLARRLEAAAIRRSDGICCLTEYTRQRTMHAARQTWTIPNAVDSRFYNITHTPEPGLALCVASITPWKRQVELIEAVDLIPEERRPKLVFLGDVPDTDYGNAFKAAVAGRRERCVSVGNVSRDELGGWLARADALILPSIEDNCPMVILEAMAAGVPVLASRIGGIPDLVVENVSGTLFDPYEPVQIAQAIDALFSNSKSREDFSKNCKHLALKHYHPEVIARKHLDLYRSQIQLH